MANYHNDEFYQYSVVVEWAESQNLMEYKGFRENCVLINSEHGLAIYGSSAYRVKPEWLDKVRKGEIPLSDENEDTELLVDYSFPFDDDEDDEVE